MIIAIAIAVGLIIVGALVLGIVTGPGQNPPSISVPTTANKLLTTSKKVMY
jgi:hypothetical protein